MGTTECRVSVGRESEGDEFDGVVSSDSRDEYVESGADTYVARSTIAAYRRSGV